MSKLGTLKRQISEMLKVRQSLWRGIIFAAPMAIIVWIVYQILNGVNWGFAYSVFRFSYWKDRALLSGKEKEHLADF
jgi:uncharacterized membrane protein